MQSGRRIGWNALSIGLTALGVAFATVGQGSEQTFIKEAMQTNIAELRFGALAAQRAENPAVREFGETLEADHRAALEHATTVARSLQVEPPEEPSVEAKGTYDGIAQLSAAQFDAAFVSHMIVTHEAAIAKYSANSHSDNPAAEPRASN